jgi:hypothetical protein
LLDLNFNLRGQILDKADDFPKVVEKSKGFLRIVVDGIPDGYNCTAYFRPSWEGGITYDLVMDGNSVIIDEYLTTLPPNPSEYVDYVLEFSIAGVNSEGTRITTNIVGIVLEKTSFSLQTENTPKIPESQIESILAKIPTVDEIFNETSENPATSAAIAVFVNNTMPIVDASYGATSDNAQSGKAVADALKTLPLKTYYAVINDTTTQTQFVLNLTAASESKYYFVYAVRVRTLGGDELLCDLEITDGSTGSAGQLGVTIKLSEPIGGMPLFVGVVYTEGEN